MTSAISTERLFSLSAFEGLRLFRSYQIKQPDLPDDQLIDLIEKIDPDGTTLDLEAGAYLGQLVPADCPDEGHEFYQACVKVVVVQHQPLWSKTMRAGRKRFVSALDLDDQDVFRAAGLMEDPPSPEVVSWWDDVAGHARLIADIVKMEQARAAEVLTLDHERERLEKLGISKAPEWFGLDDNYAGYDVLSYELGEHGLLNRLIEVKSTVASPLRFMITRNEWKQAVKSGSSYVFHVWDMAKEVPELHIRTTEQVSPHIPSDQGKGEWSMALIPLGI